MGVRCGVPPTWVHLGAGEAGPREVGLNGALHQRPKAELMQASPRLPLPIFIPPASPLSCMAER